VITLTQLAASLEPVQFAIEAISNDGTVIDPTGYPVAVAFALVTSPPTAFNPSTATWNTASWSVQAGTPGPVYWVTIQPGPGGVALAANSYIAYTKITASSSTPILPSAYLVLT
jgi:hypothetical protein